MQTIRTHVGLDVHKKSIAIAFTDSKTGEHSYLGTSPNDLTRLLKKLKPFGDPSQVQICYEAGPTGYGLYRDLVARGYACSVVAPAKTPSISSDRVKTDKRDALKLAQFLATGHLTSIRVPTPREEALRDLVRVREDLKIKETNTKRQLQSLMLRRGRIFTEGKSAWTKKHVAWLEKQQFEFADTNTTKWTYIEELRNYWAAIEELDQRIAESAKTIEQADLVADFLAFKGIAVLTATSIVVEIGDLKRFPTAAKFASFLGLTPSEHSSGETRSRGGITKAGNRRLRRLLIEAAWAYWRSPHRSRELLRRSEGASAFAKDIAWKTQHRLFKRLNALRQRGMNAKKALVAVARELACALWAVGQGESAAA